jgi:hypothetical protein
MTLSPRAMMWVYWGATVGLTFELAVGGAMDLVRGRSVVFTGDPVDMVVSSLGYPVYVLLFLGILKLLGAAVIAAPGLLRLKEWAYAGSFFQIVLAAGSPAIAGTDLINLGYPIVVMLITLVSWASRPADRVLA